jgi:hypothetical protein
MASGARGIQVLVSLEATAKDSEPPKQRLLPQRKAQWQVISGSFYVKATKP